MRKSMRVAVLTLSDSGYEGKREDKSGMVIRELVEAAGYTVVGQKILPDGIELLSAELKQLCDDDLADLILTTGGTGFSPRDLSPEATLSVVERQAPGIAEAMRWHSLQMTDRAMLSRAVAGIRKGTLIVNLPGSPKAVRECLEYILPSLGHGLEILKGTAFECARQ
ncbi:MAG: molybdenum cofactor biosynthesis protein B [Roseburia sp.]